MCPGEFANADVLMVEDDPVNQLVLVAMLKKTGVTVDLAVDGESAVDRVREKQYDLVFMDCMLPGIDGYEATRRIRAFEKDLGRRTPIVAMTASVIGESDQRCIEAGMDGVLPKPVGLDRLCATIERYQRGSRREP
jgi:CheY-like chemotaxis protein